MEEDRGSILTSNVLAFGIITFFFVLLRISYRIYTRKTSASDWILAAALASSLAQDAFNAVCVIRWGYGHHAQDLPVSISKSPEPLKLLWLNQVLFKLTTMLFKLSICLIYYNIFQRANSRMIRATRIVNYGLTFLIVGYYLPAFFISIFQCTPVSKSWLTKESATCIDLTKFRFYTAAANIITSVLVIATPLPALYKMRDTRPEVTELMGLILLGMIHTGCTIARLVIMLYPDPTTAKDPQWANITPLTIAIVEMDIGIIAASLIVMRPCFESIYHAVLKALHVPVVAASASRSRSGSHQTSSRPSNANLLRGKGGRNAEFELLESQPVSTREIVPKDLF